MSPVVQQAIAEDRDLTPDEARAFIEEQTLEYFGMTYDQFVEAAEADLVPAHPALAHLVLLTGVRSNSC
jgi:hypothetical protein